LLPCLFSELQKQSYRYLNTDQIFVVVPLVVVIFLLKQTTLVLAPFFHRASFWVCDLKSCNLRAESNKFCLGAILPCLVSEKQKPSSPEIEPWTAFGVVALFQSSLLRNKQLCSWRRCLSCSILEQHKQSSPGIGPRAIFLVYGLCFCNPLFGTNNFVLGAVLLSYLVSELQATPSPGIDLSVLCPEILHSYVLFLISRNKSAKIGGNRYIPSRAISEQININIPEISSFYV
jgi:hypothetical protein